MPSTSATMGSISPLVKALQDRAVLARVADTDNYRNGLQIGTDYIISVECIAGKTSTTFRPFMMSKTFHAFRTLASQLKKVSRHHRDDVSSSPDAVKLQAVIERDIVERVEDVSVNYLTKMTHGHVKNMNRKRSHIIESILTAMMNNFPEDVTAHKFYSDVSGLIEDFLLTDHCEENDMMDDDESEHSTSSTTSWAKKKGKSSSHFFSPVTCAASAVTKPVVDAASAVTKPVVDAVSSGAKNVYQNTVGEVRPFSRRQRRSIEVRAADALELRGALKMELDGIESGDEDVDATPKPSTEAAIADKVAKSSSQPSSPLKSLMDLVEKDPTKAGAIAMGVFAVLWLSAMKTITLRIDMELVLLVAAFSAGLHVPRMDVSAPTMAKPVTKTAAAPTPALVKRRPPLLKQKAVSASGSRPRLDVSREDPMHRLLRQSMIMSPRRQVSPMAAKLDIGAVEKMTEVSEEDEVEYVEPLARFPDGAKIGSHLNCWSQPDSSLFHVRGPGYLKDKRKVTSGDYVFPTRGMDLYLTDLCPENAASNPGVFGGKLREKPSFIINFRLPWGILLIYYEIPERLVPFVRARHENDFDLASLPSQGDMDPGDRCVARFLLGSDQHRNETLKIVPMVVQGPWIVKQAVGGKPAIIGTKMPVNYVYQRADEKKNKALYLEADLDIVASSAARGILSMVRSYTQALTIDLGFVVQGNAADELPERMLNGARIHGLDPLNAPAYPISSMDSIRGLYDGENDE